MNLTPVALMEGSLFAKTVFGGQPTAPDYNHIPYAVLCIPLSVAGLSEEEAVEKAKGDILVFTPPFNPMKNTISRRQEKVVMKLVVDAETDKVLGASMSGPDAPEIMQGIAIALKLCEFMEREQGVGPTREHISCVVDLLDKLVFHSRVPEFRLEDKAFFKGKGIVMNRVCSRKKSTK
ncbi:hypothetical protein ACS0TY_030288 [Phlomoides rotata]